MELDLPALIAIGERHETVPSADDMANYGDGDKALVMKAIEDNELIKKARNYRNNQATWEKDKNEHLLKVEQLQKGLEEAKLEKQTLLKKHQDLDQQLREQSEKSGASPQQPGSNDCSSPNPDEIAMSYAKAAADKLSKDRTPEGLQSFAAIDAGELGNYIEQRELAERLAVALNESHPKDDSWKTDPKFLQWKGEYDPICWEKPGSAESLMSDAISRLRKTWDSDEKQLDGVAKQLEDDFGVTRNGTSLDLDNAKLYLKEDGKAFDCLSNLLDSYQRLTYQRRGGIPRKRQKPSLIRVTSFGPVSFAPGFSPHASHRSDSRVFRKCVGSYRGESDGRPE